MAQIYRDVEFRCVEHPHRDAERRCARCGRQFCAECIAPGAREKDGTRGWFCRPCLVAREVERAAVAEARSLPGRVRRLGGAMRAAAGGAIVAGVLVGVVLFSARTGRAGPSAAGTCGDLTRIRAVGAIGVAGPEDAVDVLTYPNRAAVRLVQTGGTPPIAPPQATENARGTPLPATDPSAVVDECATGWRSGPGQTLPVTLEIAPMSTTAVWVQHLSLWQDTAAPRASWIKDFQVLTSPDDSGEDFQSLIFERPAQLTQSPEQQWFQVMRPAAGAVATSATGTTAGKAFPDVVPVRRLRIRVLSTYGDASVGVALGEVAAYGADLEIGVIDRGDEQVVGYEYSPKQIRALAGRPTFVLFTNLSKSRHTIVTVGQTQNLNLAAEPGQVVSGQFIAAPQVGRYEFSCRLPGHDIMGLVGSIIVR